MKHFYRLIILLSLTTHFCYGQAPAIEWQKCLGGTSNDFAKVIKPTPDGGYIVGGFVQSKDGDIIGFKGGTYDIWIAKLNNNGAVQWSRCYGGNGVDRLGTLILTTDGGYIMGGVTSSTNGDVSKSYGSTDVWIVKIDATGNIQWEKSLGGTGGEGANAIEQTSDGGYIVAGSTSSTAPYVTAAHGSSDAWIVKLDNAGNIQWEHAYGAEFQDGFAAIKQTKDGGYIAAGSSNSINANGSGDVTGNHGSNDIWVVKINSTGALQWQKSYGGSADEYTETMELTPGNFGCIILGTTNSKNGDVTNHQPTISGFKDAWLLKIDDTGNIQWQNCLGSSGDDVGHTVKVLGPASAGGYIVSAGAGLGDGNVSGFKRFGDAWILKIKMNGTIDWQQCYGGSFFDDALSIEPTLDGGFVFAGYTTSNDGDVSGLKGINNCWVVKLGAVCKPTTVISASASVACAGTPIVFSQVSTFAGPNDLFQWKVNGVIMANGGFTYTSSTLKDGDKVSCTRTTNMQCATGAVIHSNEITVSIYSVVISGDSCAGSTLTLTANVVPSNIVWSLNSIPVPTQNAATFIPQSPGNYTASITTPAGCKATSNIIKVVTTQTPQVTITSNMAAACAGSAVNFVAVPVYGGNAPLYQWKINGVSVGTNNVLSTFTTTALKAGDSVSCVMTGNATGCISSPTAVSNAVAVAVLPPAVALVSIATTDSLICAGTTVTFTAIVVNGGTNPTYQWKVNNINVSAVNNSVFSTASVKDGDVISCELTSNANLCFATPTSLSNTITIHTIASSGPAITIAANDTLVCAGSAVYFSSVAANGGPNPLYQWKVNGVNAGAALPTYNSINFKNGDVISCTLTSDKRCVVSTQAVSNIVSIQVDAMPTLKLLPDTIITSGSSVVLVTSSTGNITSYQWSPSASLNNSTIANPLATPLATTNYKLTVATPGGCKATAQVTVSVNIALLIPSGFSPNNDGINDVWNIPALSYYTGSTVEVFDRHGRSLFQSKGYGKPWDGSSKGRKLPVGTYYYVIKSKEVNKSGSVTILR